jgi:hypothetical protein
MSKGTFFVIPGFNMQAGDASFRWLVNFLKSEGFTVVKVPVKWSRSTNTLNAELVKNFINKRIAGKTATGKNYILGFSYGAVLTLLVSNDIKPNKIFLCSLSPDFKEDQKSVKDWIEKYIGKNRFNDMKSRSLKELAKNLSVPSIIFYGSEEGREFTRLKIQSENFAKLSKNSKLVMVKDAHHEIDFPNYIEAIKKEIIKLK